MSVTIDSQTVKKNNRRRSLCFFGLERLSRAGESPQGRLIVSKSRHNLCKFPGLLDSDGLEPCSLGALQP